MPPDHGELRPRSGIPDPDGPVEAGGGDPAAVGAEGHGANLVGVPLQDSIGGFDPSSAVPELDRAVIAGRGDGAAVGAERDGGDRAAVSAEDLVDQMAVAGVPDPHGVGRDSGDKGPAIRAPGQPLNRPRGALEGEGGQARLDGVEHQARLGAWPGEAAAVGAEGEGTDAAGQIGDAGPEPWSPVVRRNSPGAPVPEMDAAFPLEASEGFPVGTELHVGETVILGPEREPFLVSELPEIAPLPAAEVGLAVGRPQEVEEIAKAADVVGVPGGQGEVGARRVHVWRSSSWVARRLALAWSVFLRAAASLRAAARAAVRSVSALLRSRLVVSSAWLIRTYDHRPSTSKPAARRSTSTNDAASPGRRRDHLSARSPEQHRPRQDRLVGQEPPQVLAHRLGRLVPRLRVLLDRLQDDRLQVARDPGIDAIGAAAAPRS